MLAERCGGLGAVEIPRAKRKKFMRRVLFHVVMTFYNNSREKC